MPDALYLFFKPLYSTSNGLYKYSKPDFSIGYLWDLKPHQAETDINIMPVRLNFLIQPCFDTVNYTEIVTKNIIFIKIKLFFTQHGQRAYFVERIYALSVFLRNRQMMRVDRPAREYSAAFYSCIEKIADPRFGVGRSAAFDCFHDHVLLRRRIF